MTGLGNNRLNGRIARLENQITPPPFAAQEWIWIDGRLHSQHTDEVFDSVEERAQAYADRDILFIDRVIVTAKDGKPVAYSDKRYFDGLHEEEACR